MTIRQLTQRRLLDARSGGRKRQPSNVQDQPPSKEFGKECTLPWQIASLPTRPDDTVLSDSIPLFFIGRNENGFWVAREAAGRCGGLFLFRWSANRFARRNGLAGGGATMLVEHLIELDLPNNGSRLVKLIGIAIDIVRRHAPLVTNLIEAAIAQWRKLDPQISNREVTEKDLFRGETQFEERRRTIDNTLGPTEARQSTGEVQ